MPRLLNDWRSDPQMVIEVLDLRGEVEVRCEMVDGSDER